MVAINVSQAKKLFLQLVRQVEKDGSVVIEKKGEPVAAIISYSEYLNLNRLRSYLAMQDLSRTLKDSGLRAEEVFRESRRELEQRSVQS